jgi:hypothetical protein
VCGFFSSGKGRLQQMDPPEKSDLGLPLRRRQVQSGMRHCQGPAQGHLARSHCRQEGRKGHQDRERRKSGGQERGFPPWHRQGRSHRSSHRDDHHGGHHLDQGSFALNLL